MNWQTGERRRLTKPPILADSQYNSPCPLCCRMAHILLSSLIDSTGLWEIWLMEAGGNNPRPLFSPEVQAKFGLEYHGVNKRMLNWTELFYPDTFYVL